VARLVILRKNETSGAVCGDGAVNLTTGTLLITTTVTFPTVSGTEKIQKL